MCNTMEYYLAIKKKNLISMVLKTNMLSEGAGHKWQHIVWFHWCEMSRTGIPAETHSRLEVPRGSSWTGGVESDG